MLKVAVFENIIPVMGGKVNSSGGLALRGDGRFVLGGDLIFPSLRRRAILGKGGQKPTEIFVRKVVVSCAKHLELYCQMGRHERVHGICPGCIPCLFADFCRRYAAIRRLPHNFVQYRVDLHLFIPEEG